MLKGKGLNLRAENGGHLISTGTPGLLAHLFQITRFEIRLQGLR